MNQELAETINLRLAAVRRGVAQAAESCGRDPDEIRIVGVSKRHPADAVVTAVSAGLSLVGENRIQEAETKIPIVERMLAEKGIDPKSVRWHFVGRLQSNKANKAAALFDVIESVDSVKLAHKLSSAASDLNKQLDILIEVNVSGETAKSGIHPDELKELLDQIVPDHPVALSGIRVKGLMTMGPLTDNPDLIRAAFRKLRRLRDEFLADGDLSMGMSGDFPLAIAEGATIVRIGTAIFGLRPIALNIR